MTVTDLRPRVTLGGSSAAAAAGIDPYRSRVMLWLELTGRVERPETEAMAWGTALEPVIMAELAERGYDPSPDVIDHWRDDARPWLVGHPDGFVTLDPGARALLEVKTAGPFAHRWDESAPLHYQAQCQVYMYLTGLGRALLACLVGGQRLVLQTIDRDDTAIGYLLAALDDFYGYVLRDEPPPPDGSDSARDALALMYPSATSGLVHRLTAAEWESVRELRARKEQLAAVKAQMTELENKLKAAMGDAETAVSPFDSEALHWRSVSRTAVDVARLKELRPELASLFTTTTETRRFTVA